MLWWFFKTSGSRSKCNISGMWYWLIGLKAAVYGKTLPNVLLLQGTIAMKRILYFKKNVIFIKNETKDFCFHSRFFIFTLVNFFTGPENVLRSYFKSPLPLLNPWLCPSPQLHILSTTSNSWCWIISSPVYCKLSSMEYLPKEVCIFCIHAILNSIL